MKRGRRHGRSPHSRARAVAGGSNVGRCPIYRLPPCRRPRKLAAGKKELGCDYSREREERRGAVGGKALAVLGADVERGQCGRW